MITRMHIEYQIIKIEGVPETEQKLNELGAQGWVINVTYVNEEDSFAILSRQAEEQLQELIQQQSQQLEQQRRQQQAQRPIILPSMPPGGARSG